MDIQLEKIELIKLLKETENPSVIMAIKEIFKKEKTDWWDELSEEQKGEIELGEQQIEKGDFVTFEEMISSLRK